MISPTFPQVLRAVRPVALEPSSIQNRRERRNPASNVIMARTDEAAPRALSSVRMKSSLCWAQAVWEAWVRGQPIDAEKGTVVGTFQYMAPEVLQGAAADARSDIFSFGCVF